MNEMKKKIIKIHDISQIDTSKVSVFDFNNRYIDPSGNIYGLRHDKITRKVEIIRLRRYGARETIIHHQHAPNRNKFIDIHADNLKQENIKAEENTIKDEAIYDPEAFINKVKDYAETHKARTLGIIKNIDESGIFSKDNKQELNDFNDIVRGLEIDGVQQLERLETYHKELTNYPRTITYYQTKMDNTTKRIFEQIVANKEQAMRFIYFYEMSVTIRRVYTNLRKDTVELDELTANKNFDEKPNTPKHQKQAFLDARTSIENTIADIDEILNDNIKLFDFANDTNNFK